jgi:hypothetical protein
MRSLNRSHLIWLLAFGLWTATVHWYWKNLLPLIPADVLKADEGRVPIRDRQNTEGEITVKPWQSGGLLSNGNLAFIQRNKKINWPNCGYFESIQIWDPVHHRTAHQFFSSEDCIRQFALLDQRIAFVQCKSFVAILDLVAGICLHRLELPDHSWHIDLSLDRRFFFISFVNAQVDVYETATLHRVLSFQRRDGYWGDPDFLGNRFLLHRGAAWDLWTGERAPEYDKTDLVDERDVISPDGRLIIEQGDDFELWVCTLSKRERIWRIGDPNNEFMDYSFSRDNREVIVYSQSYPSGTSEQMGPFHMIRRSIADGAIIEDLFLADPTLRPVSAHSPDGRYVMAQRDPNQESFFDRVTAPIVDHMSALGWITDLREDRYALVAVDLSSRKQVCLIANLPTSIELAEFCPDGLLTIDTDEVIRYFPYPFQRRWAWLVGWALGPPALIFAVRLLRSRWSRRRKPIAA